MPPLSPAPVAPEHVKRLLLEMSLEGEFITEADLMAFVAKHGLPFPEELLASMFAEANSKENGLMDAEQLGKAVSYKFPYRRHNDDWARLFELAPRPGGPLERITALSPRPLEQEPIRANFEQEPNIMTFYPITNAGRDSPGLGGTLQQQSASGSSPLFMQDGAMMHPPDSRLSQASFSTAPRTLSSSAVFNTAHSLPTRAGQLPDTFNEREEEDKINRRMRPASWYTKQPASSPGVTSTGAHFGGGPSSSFDDGATQVQSFEQAPSSAESSAWHCGFDACAAFDRSVEELNRTSAGVGWKSKSALEAQRAYHAGPPPPLLHGLHPQDWLYVPGGPADHISLRVDGSVTRVTGEAATTSLRLLICENYSQHSLANSRKHALGEDPASFSHAPFQSRFAKKDLAPIHLKRAAATDRLDAAVGTEFPPAIKYLNGKPTAHEFRPPKPDPDKQPLGEMTPKFITDTLGVHWPKSEGKPASALLQANPPLSCPPLRLALTENEQPAARTTRTNVRH